MTGNKNHKTIERKTRSQFLKNHVKITELGPITIGIGDKVKVVYVKYGYKEGIKSGDIGTIKKISWQDEHSMMRSVMIDVVIRGYIYGVGPEDIEVVQ